MTFCEIYAELKGWQPVIGAVRGFGALTWGAFYNFRLGRRRDDAIRAKEALSVALGLYAEINLISVELTKLSNAIGRWYLRTGHSGQSVPTHFCPCLRYSGSTTIQPSSSGNVQRSRYIQHA